MNRDGYCSYSLESGAYPPGAEFDPNAPWNQVDPPETECKECDGSGIASDCCGYYIKDSKCQDCGQKCEPEQCSKCEGEGWREMTADEMQEEAENELAAREEQAERYYEERRGK